MAQTRAGEATCHKQQQGAWLERDGREGKRNGIKRATRQADYLLETSHLGEHSHCSLWHDRLGAEAVSILLVFSHSCLCSLMAEPKQKTEAKGAH